MPEIQNHNSYSFLAFGPNPIVAQLLPFLPIASQASCFGHSGPTVPWPFGPVSLATYLPSLDSQAEAVVATVLQWMPLC
jgi:hypothetical protein